MAPPKQFCVTKLGWYTASKDEVREQLKKKPFGFMKEGSLSISEAARLLCRLKTQPCVIG